MKNKNYYDRELQELTYAEDRGFQDEVETLHNEIDIAERDAIADFGEEAINTGGYWDIVQAIVSMSAASPAAKAEVCRMLGISMPSF